MKILHLFHFEKKFVTVAVDIFDECQEAESLIRVLTPNITEGQEFYSGRDNISVVSEDYVKSKSLLVDFSQCDCLIVHYMDELKARAILRAPKNLPIVWSGWGGDYYDLISRTGYDLLGEHTKLLVKKLGTKRTWSAISIKESLLEIARNIRYKIAYEPLIWRAIKRVDYFSSPFPEDFHLLRDYLGDEFHPEYARVFYGSVERTYLPGPKEIYGNNILVGNSATPTNNHLEIFDLLSNTDIGDRKIITPLSYGDPNYSNAISIHGKKLFGNQFHPLYDFMSLDQYNTVIAQCSIVLMGHRRQQGGGNTVTQLYKGAKVFLDEANTVYKYLKRKGAYVYCLNEFRGQRDDVFEPLNEEQKYKNRMVLEAYSSNEVVRSAVRSLVQQVREHKESRYAQSQLP